MKFCNIEKEYFFLKSSIIRLFSNFQLLFNIKYSLSNYEVQYTNEDECKQMTSVKIDGKELYHSVGGIPGRDLVSRESNFK